MNLIVVHPSFCFYFLPFYVGSDNDPLKLSPFQKMKAHKRYSLKCCFSPDSRYFVSWSAKSQELLSIQDIMFMYLLLVIFTFNFTPPISLLATTSADQTAKVWKTSGFTLQNDLHCSGQRWVWDAAFTGDSQYLLTGTS